MNKVITYLMFITLLMNACKEIEQPIVQDGVPVFYLRGIKQSDSLRFIAGKDSDYLFARNILASDSVYEYSSFIKPENCENCNDGIRVTIRSYEQSIDTKPNIIQVLSNVNYEYIQNIALPRHKIVKFENQNPVDPLASYTWDFGDGQTSNIPNPTHYFRDDNVYDVQLSITKDNCTNTIKKPVEIRIDTLPLYCRADFKFTIVNDTMISFTGNDTVFAGTFKWDFGDGEVSTDPNPNHTYAIPGNYLIKLAITRDALGCTSYIEKYINTTGAICDINFKYTNASVNNQENKNYSKVLVEYFDFQNQKYYRSDLINQINPVFELTDPVPYIENELNEPTIKFNIKFSCELIDTNSEIIKLQNMKGIMAVSY